MPTLRIKEFLEKSPAELSTYNELKIGGDLGSIPIHRLKPNKFTAFCKAIAECSNLQHIDLSDLHFIGLLTKDQISLLFEVVHRGHSQLESISLAGALYQLEKEDAQPLINLLQSCQKLISVDVSKAPQPILAEIFNALAHKHLACLNVSHCDIREVSEEFCNTVQTLSSLKSLTLEHNNLWRLTSVLQQKVFNSIAYCSQLQKLNIAMCYISPMDDTVFEDFKTMLIKCTSLEEVVIKRLSDRALVGINHSQLETLNTITNLRTQEQKIRDKTTLLCLLYRNKQKPLAISLPTELGLEALEWRKPTTPLKIFSIG